MNSALKIENLSFGYNGNKTVLTDISLDIKAGEKVAVTGPNGAGKSTLISLLNGIRWGNGSIFINGNELTKKSATKIRSDIGIVFQNPDDQLFCPTVFDDIAFGPLNYGMDKDKIRERVTSALEDVGLTGSEDRLINELSFGERKLVSIATVLSMTPSIIAFDEPTSNLDPYHRRKIIKWIKENRSQTIIITTHDLDMALETCDRVIVLNEGKIVASGNAEKILTDKDLLESNRLELPLSRQ